MIYVRNFCKTIQKMKIIKIILLFASIVFFTSIPLQAKAGHEGGIKPIDCKTAIKLHEKLICKARGEDTPSSIAKEEKTKKKKEKKVKKKTTEVKKKIEGDMKSLWQKIKNFGGENIGEEG